MRPSDRTSSQAASEPPLVTLRPVEDADVPIFFEQQRDPDYDRMAAFTRKDPHDRGAFVAHWEKMRRDPSVFLRTIVARDAAGADEVVGSIATWLLGAERQVTYGIARTHWGRGLASEALRLFLPLQPERPLFASAAADNAGSLRVLEKHGFCRIGSERAFANARREEIDEVLLRLD